MIFCALMSFNMGFSMLIGGAIGFILSWIYWHFAIKRWMSKFIKSGLEEQKLQKYGQYFLLLWPK